MEQLATESKSLWRIKNDYISDTDGCGECDDFWKDLAEDKEEHIEKLEEMLKEHMSN